MMKISILPFLINFLLSGDKLEDNLDIFCRIVTVTGVMNMKLMMMMMMMIVSLTTLITMSHQSPTPSLNRRQPSVPRETKLS